MTIDKALDDIMQLDEASREMLLGILQKRQTEANRKRIAKNAEDAITEFHNGNFSPLSAEEAAKYLDSL